MKLIIFDADGTLTPQRPTSVSPGIFELLPGRKEKIKSLNTDHLTIASNQSEKRPIIDILQQLEWTADMLSIPMQSVIFATAKEKKKPNPWMLEMLIAEFNVNPQDVLFVGDQETDKQAAEAAGVNFQWTNEFFGEGE